MKAKIHPIYFDDAQAVCACGNTFTTGSTKKTLALKPATNVILFILENINS